MPPTPAAFVDCYHAAPLYPCNGLLSADTYPSVLEDYRQRLTDSSGRLFSVDDNDVTFRDYKPNYNAGVARRNIQTLPWLKAWLGDQSSPTDRYNICNKEDPICRLIYIYGDDSKSRLKISKDWFTRILSHHQVMPTYIDFVSVFGEQNPGEPNDIRFSGFREQIQLGSPAIGPVIPSLGRSGRRYSLCFNLKSVTEVSRGLVPQPALKQREWPRRQAAIHHQFDVEEGRSLWIITKGRTDLLDRVADLLSTTKGRPQDRDFTSVEGSFRSTLAVMLLLCNWSCEEWRWYIRWLESLVEQSQLALYGSRNPGAGRVEYSAEEYQDLQLWEDRTNEAAMLMESNIEIMDSLRKFYASLRDNADFDLRQSCRQEIIVFESQIGNMIRDMKMHDARAKVLSKITTDRKTLIQQHLQTQATERMEMLNRHMQKESVVMRIITLVTLIYLPATFVSTFFSTDVVKYQKPDGGHPGNGNFSSMAFYRWLQVTLPLTFLTLVAAGGGIRYADWKRKREEAGYWQLPK